MKLLLDTHVFVWALLEPERMRKAARGALEAPGNELWLSPISVWEMLVLAEKGRLLLRPDAETWIRAALRDTGPREAPLTAEVALRSRSVEVTNADPADRFIAASASVYGLTLVTADGSLQRAKGIEVLRA